MTAPSHLTDDQALGFRSGSLTEEDLALVQAHLVSCETCRNLVDATSHPPSIPTVVSDVPEPAIQRARALHSEIDGVPIDLVNSKRYRVLRKLGQGGMGAVYLAEQVNLVRVVALKVIRPDLVIDAKAVRRFRQEAMAAAQLHHPNIVVTHDADQEGDTHFIVMSYMEGMDLASMVRKQGPLEVHFACALARQIALGLQNAHEKGMVHRDIKPGNVMVSLKGHVTILDFGLAKLTRGNLGDAWSSVANLAIGTPAYMAPEQAKDSHSVDIRADIYSLGCTLFFLLTAQPPFVSDMVMEVLMAHAIGQPPSLLDRRQDIPPRLAEIVARMLAKNPNDRYPRPEHVAAALLPYTTKLRDGGGGGGALAPPRNMHSFAPLACSPPVQTKPPAPNTPLSGGGRGKAIRAMLFLIAPVLLFSLVWTLSPIRDLSSLFNRPVGHGVMNPGVGAIPRDELFVSWSGGSMVKLQGGTFLMGSPVDETGRAGGSVEKQHRVTVSPFFLGETEVTQGQFRKVMGYNPSYFCRDAKGLPGVDYGSWKPGDGAAKVAEEITDTLPIENVSWGEAKEYCNRLNELDKNKPAGWVYRLPSEAEWEYACRAGASSYTVFHFGNALDDSRTLANFDGRKPYNSDRPSEALDRTRRVGSYRPNQFGFLDMHGNVFEWCEDYYADDYYTSSEGVTDPTGPKEGQFRAIRGGSWRSAGEDCRSASRENILPDKRSWYLGFRIALVPVERK